MFKSVLYGYYLYVDISMGNGIYKYFFSPESLKESKEAHFVKPCRTRVDEPVHGALRSKANASTMKQGSIIHLLAGCNRVVAQNYQRAEHKSEGRCFISVQKLEQEI